MTHGRRYGDKDSHPIPLWNGILDHCEQIGPALWEFIWCLDRITLEDAKGIGWCLGRSEIKAARIAVDLRESKQTARANLRRLEKYKYIVRVRTPWGFQIGVRNSKKFGIWKGPPKGNSELQKTVTHSQTELQEIITLSDSFQATELQKTVTRRDAAVTQHKDAAGKPSASDTLNTWKVLGRDLPMGSPRFQKIFEHYVATRKGNPLSEAMERTIQMANNQAVKVPPPFFEAKRQVERREKEELAAPSDDLPVLEAEPWAR